MVRFLRFLTRRERAYDRVGKTGRLYLFSAEHRVGAATLIDESEGGARLQSDCDRFEEVNFILNPATATVITVRLAWATNGQAGFEYLAFTNLRGFVHDPALAHVRDAWVDVAQEFSLIAPGGAFKRSA